MCSQCNECHLILVDNGLSVLHYAVCVRICQPLGRKVELALKTILNMYQRFDILVKCYRITKSHDAGSLFGKHESCKILNHVEERYIVLEPLDLTY